MVDSNYNKLVEVAEPGACYLCSAPAFFYKASRKRFCCLQNARKCPGYLAKQSKTTQAHSDSILAPELRAEIQKKKHAEAQTLRWQNRSSAEPPPGQLCENGCGELARFHLSRNTETPTGHCVRWYWCCNDHYRKCSALLESAEEKRQATHIARYGSVFAQEFLDKRDQTSIERYGVSHAMKLPEFIEKKQQVELERHGSLTTGIEKSQATRLKLHGTRYVFCLPGMALKAQATMRARFGGVHYSQNQQWQDDYEKATGFTHPKRNPKVEAKRIKTCITRYSVTHPMQVKEVRQRVVATCMRKYGVTHPMQVNEIKQRSRATCAFRHGAPNPMQCPAIFHTKLNSNYAFKSFTFPSGRVVRVQGYEPFVIQELLDSGILEPDILIGVDCPSFFYELEGKQHRYYPDIFVSSQHKIIEVKSEYTYLAALNINLIKRQAVLDAGYLFEFHIKHSAHLDKTTIVTDPQEFKSC